MTQYVYVINDRIALDAQGRLPSENHADVNTVPLVVDLVCETTQHTNEHASASPMFIAYDASKLKLPSDLNMVSVRTLLSDWPLEQLHQVFRAIQLVRWQQDHMFCSRCGTKTVFDKTENAAVCPTCHYRQYPRVQPCVIVAITKTENGKKQLLLAKDKRAKLPFHSLIAGFVEAGETLEHAVLRETYEETGLKLKNIHYLGSQPWPFPSNLMVAFHAEYDSGELKLAEDELEDANFYTFDCLPVIPPKGSIAHSMIQHICFNIPLEL